MFLRLRILAVLALALGAVAVLVPGWVVQEPLRLGVDLRGGSELQLRVDTDAAVADGVSEDALFLAAEMQPGTAVHQRAMASLEVVSDAPSSDVVRMVDEVLLGSYRHVSSDGRVHRFELSPERADKVGEEALVRVQDRIRDRLNCMESSSVERVGVNGLLVQLPGEVDLSRCLR